LSSPQGLRLAVFGLTAPFAGGLMLRYGPWRMVIAAGVILMLGLALAASTTEKWQLWLGMGVLLGIAPGLTAMQLSAVISSRWFVARRGLVIGLLSGAIATGTLIFMPLAAWASERWGWRVAIAWQCCARTPWRRISASWASPRPGWWRCPSTR
jgi:MFS family permease